MRSGRKSRLRGTNAARRGAACARGRCASTASTPNLSGDAAWAGELRARQIRRSARLLQGLRRLRSGPPLSQTPSAITAKIIKRHNYLLPSAKLEQKSREGAQVKRRHDKPLTPCDRLLGSPNVDAASKRKLWDQRAELNPFDLHRRLEHGLRSILHRALHSSRPSDSLHCALDAGTPPPIPVS